LSQTSQTCTQCGAKIEAGQQFCASCGAPAPRPADQSTSAPTYASASPPSNPGYQPTQIAGASNPGYPPTHVAGASNPGYPPPPYTGPGGSSPQTTQVGGGSYPDYLSNVPSYGSEVGASAPAPYADPYNTPMPPAPPPTPMLPYYAPPPVTTNQRPPWFTPVMILVTLVVIAGAAAGIWSMTRGGGGGGVTNNTDNTSFAATQNLNLKATYASVEMTFTSLEQKTEFDDDTSTTYGSSKNWVRLNFKENLPSGAASYGAIYSYSSVFTLILPDGKEVKAKSSKDYSGPEDGVAREQWVDFGTTSQVDLSKLQLRLGGGDENAMQFALKDGTDLSKFQPKEVTLNKSFIYATMDWKLTKVTQSLYFGGDQAKKDKVFLIFELTASNKSSQTVYLDYNFLRLKSGESTAAPESGSSLNDLDIVESNTTNVNGAGIFQVTQTSDNAYTLVFPKSKYGDYGEVTLPVTVA
jgi:hypothetical protein